MALPSMTGEQERLHVHVQVSGSVSQLEARVAGVQQSVLRAKDLLQLKLRDAVAAHKQAEQQLRVRCVCVCLRVCVCLCVVCGVHLSLCM